MFTDQSISFWRFACLICQGLPKNFISSANANTKWQKINIQHIVNKIKQSRRVNVLWLYLNTRSKALIDRLDFTHDITVQLYSNFFYVICSVLYKYFTIYITLYSLQWGTVDHLLTFWQYTGFVRTLQICTLLPVTCTLTNLKTFNRR